MTRSQRFVAVMQAFTSDADVERDVCIHAVLIAASTPEECVPRNLIGSAFDLIAYLKVIADIDEGEIHDHPPPTWLAELLEREGQTLQQFIDNA